MVFTIKLKEINANPGEKEILTKRTKRNSKINMIGQITRI
jgi:hypothetical protein